jgi:hypothetical protein
MTLGGIKEIGGVVIGIGYKIVFYEDDCSVLYRPTFEVLAFHNTSTVNDLADSSVQIT